MGANKRDNGGALWRVRHGRQNHVDFTVNEFADAIACGDRNELWFYIKSFGDVPGKVDFNTC